MTENKSFFNSMTILGLLLALSMASAAFILGVQAKRAESRQQSIAVKGLAEKPIQVDSADWTITVSVNDDTQAKALQAAARTRRIVEALLAKQDFDKSAWSVDLEKINPHFIEIYDPNYRRVRKGDEAHQVIRVVSNDLSKIKAANKAILQLRTANQPIIAHSPKYLFSNLEDIKMSLIADATKNARRRAIEFVKQDGANFGVMKSAKQGTFSILALRGNGDSDNSYGGVYDKSTIDKTARVVVAIV